MTWILAHPLQIVAGYWVFSAIVSGMPDPSPISSIGYTWAHRSLHILAGNLASVAQSKYSNFLPPPSPPAAPGETVTTVGVLTEQRSGAQPIPNNGK